MTFAPDAVVAQNQNRLPAVLEKKVVSDGRLLAARFVNAACFWLLLSQHGGPL